MLTLIFNLIMYLEHSLRFFFRNERNLNTTEEENEEEEVSWNTISLRLSQTK